jgi:hypothetical protein
MNITTKIAKIKKKFLIVLLLGLTVSGCSRDTYHYKHWIASFIVDSVTIGAVEIEYDITSWQFVLSQGNDYKNVNLDFYTYSLKTNSAQLNTHLESGLSNDLYAEAGSVKYQKPWIAYTCNRGVSQLVAMNLETGQKNTLLIDQSSPAVFFSKYCKYLLVAGNSSYKIFNVGQNKLVAQFRSDRDNALYIDEATDCMFINNDSLGIQKYSILDTQFVPFVSRIVNLKDWEYFKLIDYGSTILVYKRPQYLPADRKYFKADGLLLDTIDYYPVSPQLGFPDIDLKTGDATDVSGSDVYIENIFGNFQYQLILDHTKKKK